MTEKFSACWDNHDEPYLIPTRDIAPREASVALSPDRFIRFFYDKSTGIQMSRRKGTANFQFFADDKLSLFAYDFQTHNSTAFTALNGNEVENFPELQAGAFFNQRA